MTKIIDALKDAPAGTYRRASFAIKKATFDAHQIQRGDFVRFPGGDGWVDEILPVSASPSPCDPSEQEELVRIRVYVVEEQLPPQIVEWSTGGTGPIPVVLGERRLPEGFGVGGVVPPQEPILIGENYHGSFLPWSIAERLGILRPGAASESAPAVGSPTSVSNSSEEEPSDTD